MSDPSVILAAYAAGLALVAWRIDRKERKQARRARLRRHLIAH
jgi:hypothetical protein